MKKIYVLGIFALSFMGIFPIRAQLYINPTGSVYIGDSISYLYYKMDIKICHGLILQIIILIYLWDILLQVVMSHGSILFQYQ